MVPAFRRTGRCRLLAQTVTECIALKSLAQPERPDHPPALALADSAYRTTFSSGLGWFGCLSGKGDMRGRNDILPGCVHYWLRSQV